MGFDYIDTKTVSIAVTSIQNKTIVGLPKYGLFPFKDKLRWGYMNASGMIVIKPQFDWAYPFNDSVGLIITGDFFQYINLKGELVSEKKFSEAKKFSCGFGLVKYKRKWNFINK
ncbi:MAG: WG repeat-containing protein, partial [Bacteroidia bacterium]|nr:WG repeat-containing protein [Bacteroidia bacterium]